MDFYKKTAIILTICLSACCKEHNHKDCELIPDPGPCKALFKKYYFDQKEKKCKEFIYGGCNGVVPFETLENCKKNCPCAD